MVDIVASSTSRDLTAASLTFTAASGAQLNGTKFTVQLSDIAGAWFGDVTSLSAGGAFEVQIPFTFSGDTSAIGAVSVTLTNSAGTSSPISGVR
jgi:hypothetical protein